MTATRNFLEPVHLSAGRLYLRPTEPADEPAVAVALRDPGIARWNTGISIARAPEAERAAMWLRVRDQGWASGAAANFAVLDATTGALLGTVGIRDINRLPEQALAGYWTTPAARGQGIAPRGRREGRIPARGHDARILPRVRRRALRLASARPSRDGRLFRRRLRANQEWSRGSVTKSVFIHGSPPA